MKVHIIYRGLSTVAIYSIISSHYNLYVYFCSGTQRECPSLDNPKYGTVIAKEGRGVGAEVWYTCQPGFTLVGSESQTCQSDLTWTPNAPVCRRT